MTVDDLLASRRLERVPADPDGARRQIDAAARHLTTAAAAMDLDPDAAYAVLYDAARKAISAHMLASGLRARNAPGSHAAVGVYAAAVLRTPSAAEFDRMRRFRHRVEYGTTGFSPRQVAHDLRHAEAIVAEVTAALGA